MLTKENIKRALIFLKGNKLTLEQRKRFSVYWKTGKQLKIIP